MNRLVERSREKKIITFILLVNNPLVEVLTMCSRDRKLSMLHGSSAQNFSI